jgi:hypothetical protein
LWFLAEFDTTNEIVPPGVVLLAVDHRVRRQEPGRSGAADWRKIPAPVAEQEKIGRRRTDSLDATSIGGNNKMQKALIIPALTVLCTSTGLVGLTTLSIAGSYPICLTGGDSNTLRCEFSSLEQCQASASGGLGYCIRNPAVAAMPWPAPVGHRQPRADDSVDGTRFPGNAPGDVWLDQELDDKLRICRGC